ncbi:MAG: NAD-dependent epimerase, partial [Bacteroidetes bacterium SW_10_40_5]
PMLYMPDAIKGTIQIMEAPHRDVKVRSSYNVAGFSFAPQDLAHEIQSHLSGFTIAYNPDFRQQIADGWPSSINDSKAQEDWNWNPSFSFSDMVEDMIKNIQVTSNSL